VLRLLFQYRFAAIRGLALLPVAVLAASVLVTTIARGEVFGTDAEGESIAQAAQPAAQFVDHQCRKQRLVARIRFLAQELEIVRDAQRQGSSPEVLLQRVSALEQDGRKAIGRFLGDNTVAATEDLEQVARLCQSQIHESRAGWEDARTSVNWGNQSLFEARAGEKIAAQVASLLSVNKRWFWLSGLIAMASLVGVVAHERRHEIRRRFNGNRARAMGLFRAAVGTLAVLLVLTVVTFVMGDALFDWLGASQAGERSPRQAIAEENEQLAGEVADLEKKSEESRQALDRELARWSEAVDAAFPQNRSLAARWREYFGQLGQLAECGDLLANMPAAMQGDLDDWAVLKEELDKHRESIESYRRTQRWIRGGLGLGLVGIVALGGGAFLMGLRRRQQATFNTCPRCLTSGALMRVPGSDRSGSASVQCTKVLNRQKQKACNYVFPASHRAVPKICFPTLGAPQAGKTHWLSMVHNALTNRPMTEIQMQARQTEASKKLDQIAATVLGHRIGPQATQTADLPFPLVFDFEDKDWAGRSERVVDVFDYSGEVIVKMDKNSTQRRRALDADGYLFFLDPTFPRERQVEALNRFREDLRDLRGLGKEQKLHAPIALCISKIDLLPNGSYASADGDDAVDWFYKRLGKIDPSGDSMELSVLEARSGLTAELRDMIWPNWDIEGEMEKLFGGRYLFFPLTPVGLTELGETDLAKRTIDPFGILQPLMWLLHMNGYPILK